MELTIEQIKNITGKYYLDETYPIIQTELPDNIIEVVIGAKGQTNIITPIMEFRIGRLNETD